MRSFLAVALALLLIPICRAAEPVRARHGMVVSSDLVASEAGVEILKRGGNAVDAAVAVAFALAVTHPAAGNIGGGGFMLIRQADGAAVFLDFRETAPASAHRDMYVTKAAPQAIESGYQGEKVKIDLSPSLVGWRASGVPGTVRGLELASKKYGRKPWADLVMPAVKLAKHGFPVNYNLAASLRDSAALLERFPESKRIFLRDGRYYEMDDIFRQPELGETLERIAREGAGEFYEGETARRIAAAMAAHGGEIKLADLKAYRAVEREPLRAEYGGCTILTAPPPSSGGVGIAQMLGMLDGSGYAKDGFNAASTWHYLAEVMRRYYADRSEFLADPGFHQAPLGRLLDKQYLAARRSTIDPAKATPSTQVAPGAAPGHESPETTHFSIVDGEGNAVAMTYTLNGSYGSGVTVPGVGMLLNNEMDDFATVPGQPNMFGLVQGEANRVEPGKRPLSSMTPTIVEKEGKLRMVAGAPGGGRIINAVLQALLNVIDFGMDAQRAVDAPRIHHQWMPDTLYAQPGVSPDTVAILERMGYHVARTERIGDLQVIVVNGEWLEGGSNAIPHGGAAGY